MGGGGILGPSVPFTSELEGWESVRFFMFYCIFGMVLCELGLGSVQCYGMLDYHAS